MAFATVSVLQIKSWQNNGLPEGFFQSFFFFNTIFTEAKMQIKNRRISPQSAN